MRYPVLLSIAIASTLIAASATPARADACDKLTVLTFSGPVGLPGVTLPAGTYRFTHPECTTTSGILRVMSEDGRTVYGTFLTIPDDRITPSRRPKVVFAERSAGAPEAIKAWFYPGDHVGDALIYPKSETHTG